MHLYDKIITDKNDDEDRYMSIKTIKIRQANSKGVCLYKNVCINV